MIYSSCKIHNLVKTPNEQQHYKTTIMAVIYASGKTDQCLSFATYGNIDYFWLLENILKWKFRSGCADVQSGPGLQSLHNLKSPFLIFWHNCPLSEPGHFVSAILYRLVLWVQFFSRRHIEIIFLFSQTLTFHAFFFSNADNLHKMSYPCFL